MTRKKARGVGLLSGGLDSALAALILKDAGVEVECLHFFTGFCVTGHNSRVGRTTRPIANHALQVAAEMGIPVELVDISEEYLPMVLNPRFGYGRNMNPCVDCRIFMLNKAKERMEETGADFVFTGEVIGQRPKSQLKTMLRAIEKDTGLEGRLLRPLSAKALPPTLAEQQGLVDREKLYGIFGRGRKMQIELARRFGLKTFMQPSGGCCFLTDEAYSNKFRDVIEHGGVERLSVEDVFVLGVGRHFRLSPNLKVIVGRDEIENNFLSYYTGNRWSAVAVEFAGPVAVILGDLRDDEWETIASIVARYCGGKEESTVDVRFVNGDDVKVIAAAPATREFLDTIRI